MKSSQAHVETAKRLLAQEDGGSRSEEPAAAAGRVYEALFHVLAPIIGAAGVEALCTRSLKLTKLDFPCLRELPLNPEPPATKERIAQHLMGCVSKLEPAAASEVATAFYARFLALLGSLIGEPLVWQIVISAFPAPDTGSKEKER